MNRSRSGCGFDNQENGRCPVNHPTKKDQAMTRIDDCIDSRKFGVGQQEYPAKNNHDRRRRDPHRSQDRQRAAFFQRRDHWLRWLDAELLTERARQLSREADVDVAPHTALVLADVIGNSGPSFAREGIYAQQETLAANLAKGLTRAKADVRLVRRGLKLLVKVGALRVKVRRGRRTNLLVHCWRATPCMIRRKRPHYRTLATRITGRWHPTNLLT
jgi:hypothetical protein